MTYWASSAVLFTIVGLLYWLGLTPGYIAHPMSHAFGDPVLTMGILQGALALSGLRH